MSRSRAAQSEVAPYTGPRFDMRCFGTFELVDTATGLQVTPRSRKARAVLAFLALGAQGAASRDRLVGLLWGERGEAQARASLRQILSELRAIPGFDGSIFRTDRSIISLDGSALTTDLARAQACLHAGDGQRLAALLADCQPTLLDDLAGLDPRFDDWLYAERTRRFDALVGDILRLIGTTSAPDTYPVVRSLLAFVEQLDPGNEAIARAGLRADHAAGDLAALHRRYRRLTDQLQRDYSASPSLETRRLFESLARDRQMAAPPTIEAALPLAPAPTDANNQPPIVVIAPLAALGANGEARLLADACADDVLTALGRFRELRVLGISTDDSARLASLRDIAIAAYIVNGTIREQVGAFRVNLRMSRLDTGLIVWTQTLTIARTDLASALDAIVARIAGAIGPVIDHELTQLPPRRYGDPAAFELYLRARSLLRHPTSLEVVRTAADLLERAIVLDPTMTKALLHLGRLYNTDFLLLQAGHDPAPLRERALVLAERAVALDRDSAHARMRLGWCHLRRGAWTLARDCFDAAVELNPFYADCINAVGFGICHLGDLDTGASLLTRAFELNPLPAPEYYSDLAVARLLQGDHREAEAQFQLSSDTSLHYLALRIANLTNLTSDSGLIDELTKQLRTRFAAIWQGISPPTDADVIAWLDNHLPFRMPEHRALLHAGLGRAGLAADPDRHRQATVSETLSAADRAEAAQLAPA